MSTLEKAINLLKDMPEQTIKTVYAFMLSIQPKEDNSSDNTKSMDGLQLLQSYAGTLPEDFDYKKELEREKERKYGYNKSTFGFGIAHEYANPELIEQEKGAFERAMLKKHALDRYEEV